MLDGSNKNTIRRGIATGLGGTVMTLLALLAPTVWAAGDVEAGKIKAETCKGCHAIANYKNSYPSYRVPKLRGQNVEYLMIALRAYRDGLRKHPTMKSQAEPMTEQDIEDIAAYIGSLD